MNCPKCGIEIDTAIDDPFDLTIENQQWWHSSCYVTDLKTQLATVTKERDTAVRLLEAERMNELYPAIEKLEAVTKDRDTLNDNMEEMLQHEHIITCPLCNGRGGECPLCCNGSVMFEDVIERLTKERDTAVHSYEEAVAEINDILIFVPAYAQCLIDSVKNLLEKGATDTVADITIDLLSELSDQIVGRLNYTTNTGDMG